MIHWLKIAHNKDTPPVGLPWNDRKNMCSRGVLSTKPSKLFFGINTNTEYFLGHSARAGAQIELPLHFQISSIYGNTLRKARRWGTSLPLMWFSLPKHQGLGGLRREEQLTGLQGLLQSPSSCRKQRGMDTAPEGCGNEQHTALVWSQGGPWTWPGCSLEALGGGHRHWMVQTLPLRSDGARAGPPAPSLEEITWSLAF